MEEQNTSELIGIFIKLLMVLGVLAMFFVGFQLHRFSSFKQEVNYTIERQGGINPNSIKAIQKISDSYDNYYVVNGFIYDKNHNGKIDDKEGLTESKDKDKTTTQTVEPQPYGTAFTYRVKIKIPIPFMSFVANGTDQESIMPTHFEATGYGSAVSKVRSAEDK